MGLLFTSFWLTGWLSFLPVSDWLALFTSIWLAGSLCTSTWLAGFLVVSDCLALFFYLFWPTCSLFIQVCDSYILPVSLSALLEKLLPDHVVVVLLVFSFARGRLGPAALQTCRVRHLALLQEGSVRLQQSWNRLTTTTTISAQAMSLLRPCHLCTHHSTHSQDSSRVIW